MPNPTNRSLPRLIGACLSMAAFLAILVWGLGSGLEVLDSALRATGGAILMFFVGLILGKAMGDSIDPPAPPSGTGEKKQEISRKPLT